MVQLMSGRSSLQFDYQSMWQMALGSILVGFKDISPTLLVEECNGCMMTLINV